MESRTQSEPALRTRTRNVAWNASAGVVSSRRTARQVLQTNGPCRSNQRGERGLGGFAVSQREPLEQLPIRDPGERADVEEGFASQAGRPDSGSVRTSKDPGGIGRTIQ